MIVVVIFATLLGSLSNATAGVLQRRATGTPDPRELFSPRFIQALIKNRIWLMGLGLDLLGFVLQATALNFGALSIVQPLMMTNLIFLLLILYFRFKVPMTKREWGGGLAICAGLAILLAVANPHGGQAVYNAGSWLLAIVIIGIFIIASAGFVRRIPSPAWRAGLAGMAAGANFALTAALTKLVLDQLHIGLMSVITGWEVYALIASAIATLVTMQSAYGAGPLAVSTPAMQIVDPLLGMILGVVILGDIISFSPIAIVVEVVCGLIIVGGTILLTGSKRIQQYSHL